MPYDIRVYDRVLKTGKTEYLLLAGTPSTWADNLAI
jgi:hypothetical protein